MSDEGNSYRRIMQMRADAERIRSGALEVPPIIPTGLVALDHKLNGGLPREKLCVIAARTSHGKTATAVRLAVNMTMAGRRVHVFWLEDTEMDFDMRAIAAMSNRSIPQVWAAYRRGELDRIIDSIPRQRMDKWPLPVTHWMERPNIYSICEQIEMLPRNSVAIIDHLGEIEYPPGNRWETMGEGLRMLRSAAWKAQVLVVALTQLNRDWDRRKAQSKDPDAVRPVLSDIENSGQIEQVARVCIIAEKCYTKDESGEIATGKYRYHIWKPYEALAECKWDERSSTPDNLDPAPMPEPQQGQIVIPQGQRIGYRGPPRPYQDPAKDWE